MAMFVDIWWAQKKKLADFLGEFVKIPGVIKSSHIGRTETSSVIFGKDSKTPNFCPSKSMIGIDSCPKFGAREIVSFRECI